MKKLFMAITIFFMLSGLASAGTKVTLGWGSNTEDDLAGYRVYQDGVAQVPDVLCIANDTTCCTWTSQELTEGNHEWFLTAFDESQNESGHSNTVSYNVDLTSPGIPINIQITVNINVGN